MYTVVSIDITQCVTVCPPQYQYMTFVLLRVQFVQNIVGFNSHMWNRSRYTVKPPLTCNFSGDNENSKIPADTEKYQKLVGFIR